MSSVHEFLGWIAIGLNVGAAALGGVAWLARRNPRPFWWLLRGGQGLIMLEAATDNPAGAKLAMLQRIAAAGGVRFTDSLIERAGPVVGPRVRRLLDTMGLAHVGAA